MSFNKVKVYSATHTHSLANNVNKHVQSNLISKVGIIVMLQCTKVRVNDKLEIIELF